MRFLLISFLISGNVFVSAQGPPSCSLFCGENSGIVNSGSCFWIEYANNDWISYYTFCTAVASVAGFSGHARLAVIDTAAKWTAIQEQYPHFTYGKVLFIWYEILF